MGYGKNQTTTTAKNLSCYYFRRTLQLSKQPASNVPVQLNWTADDGFVIYVNGTEAGRYNMPSGTPTYSTAASTYADGNPDSGTMELSASLFNLGTNIIAVEVHNNQPSSSDILWQGELKVSYNSNATSSQYVSTETEYTLPSSGSVNLTAMWEKESSDTKLLTERCAPIKINEVSAGNSMCVNDYFKKNDWVELYNTTDETLDVTGLCITDDLSKPTKYTIKGNGTTPTEIGPKGHIVVWCDKLEPFEQLHATFKLSNDDVTDKYKQLVMISSSETFVANNKAFFTSHPEMAEFTDTLMYNKHDGTESVGRYPDGSASYYVFDHPTINAANSRQCSDVFVYTDLPWISGEESGEESSEETALGNVNAETTADDGATPVTYMTLNGLTVNAEDVTPGIYLVRYSNGTVRKVVIK